MYPTTMLTNMECLSTWLARLSVSQFAQEIFVPCEAKWLAVMDPTLTDEVKKALEKIGLDPNKDEFSLDHAQYNKVPDMTLSSLLVTYGGCVLVLLTFKIT